MRDVSAKISSLRVARARAVVHVSPESIKAIRENRVPKGDPLPVAKVAAIQAVKQTPLLIPYCHTVPIEHVAVEFEVGEDTVAIEVTVKSVYKTGVEMEAMAGAMVAALNIYDVLKMIDDTMSIGSVTLEHKSGGKSNFKTKTDWTFAVLVVSDRISAGEREDQSGKLLAESLASHGGSKKQDSVVPDEPELIRKTVQDWSQDRLDLIVLTGGTGLGPRDTTPEALAGLFDQELPGVVSALHGYGQVRTPLAMLSRLTAGVVGGTVVVALPGSPAAVKDAVDCLFPYLTHLFDIVQGGCHE